MADHILPTKPSAKLLDYVGLGLVLMPIEAVGPDFIKQNDISSGEWSRAVLLVLCGFLSLAVGVRWENMKPGATGRLNYLDPIARNPLTWVVIAGAIVFGVPTVLGRTSPATFIGEMIPFAIMVGLMWIFFRPLALAGGLVLASLSREELDYRVQQRKFVLSNLNEMLEAYLGVMHHVHAQCTNVARSEQASQACRFALLALNNGIIKQYSGLKNAAQNDFSGLTTEETNDKILEFLFEYAKVCDFPSEVEVIASLQRSSRDNWNSAHQRCEAALRDLTASRFVGSLSGTATSTPLMDRARAQMLRSL